MSTTTIAILVATAIGSAAAGTYAVQSKLQAEKYEAMRRDSDELRAKIKGWHNDIRQKCINGGGTVDETFSEFGNPLKIVCNGTRK